MLNADSREALVELSQAVGEPIADVGAWRRAKLDSEGCEVTELCVGAFGTGWGRVIWLPGGSQPHRRGDRECCACRRRRRRRRRRRACACYPLRATCPRRPPARRRHLSGCGLADLPAAVGRLAGLRKLVLTQNALRDLPPSLAALPRLQVRAQEAG